MTSCVTIFDGFGHARARSPFSLRAKAYIQLKRPHGAITDCNAVLALNPDSAQGFKWRGKANAMLGNWSAAYKDLTQVCCKTIIIIYVPTTRHTEL